ncbi:MAG TPA: DUF4271 domain-containing protein [Candidatus Coprenecus stercoravium]|uniref:DUF4271 domain-containing protein n=1 Tax=Candidatus Coprenecus stercoravium TaxID=2840735 RepID=A0A9D2GR23_9BACT|nr:DUF4271 domain-containing protein [Candidatus Coprenecus stercoravium]
MRLNAVIDMLPVDGLWEGSRLSVYEVFPQVPFSVEGTQYFVWGILFLIFFCLVFRTPAAALALWAGGFMRSPAKRTYFDTSAAVRFGLPVSMVIFLPVFSFLIYGSGAVDAPYALILGVVAGFILLRAAVLQGIAYVTGEKDFVQTAGRAFMLFFLLVTAVFCVVYIIGMFLPDIFPVLAGKVIPALSILLLAVYVIELLRIIFAFKEPVFLSILYLCTLEFLPIATAVVTIIKY